MLTEERQAYLDSPPEADLSGLPDAVCDFPDCVSPPGYLIIFGMNCRCGPDRYLVCAFHERRYRVPGVLWICSSCGVKCIVARIIAL